MYKLKKQFSISCGHRLYNDSLSEGTNKRLYGKCINHHGHNHKIILYLKSSKLIDGMILNFNIIKDIFKDEIDDVYDHKFLNDCVGFEKIIPTAENMCKVFYDKLKGRMSMLYAVEIFETDGASATYVENKNIK